MRVEKNKNGTYKVWLNQKEYHVLRDNAPARENRIMVRLGGESGLRAFEIPQIKPKHIHDNFVRVPKGKDTSGQLGGKSRDSYLNDDLKRELAYYQQDNGLDPNEPFFDYSDRTIKRKIKAAANVAAEATGDRDFLKVSSHDLRRYFAHTLLVREKVNPEVVMEVGGWSDYESIKPYLNKPTEETIEKEMKRVEI